METLNEYPLPPESIPHVLQAWRYSLNLGAEFTIRQAKWASRLYSQEPDTTKLWFISRRYSHEEELALLTDTKMKVHDISSENSRTYIYTDGFEYQIFGPKRLFITESGSHRVQDVDGDVHYPKSDWRAILWSPNDKQNPVKF